MRNYEFFNHISAQLEYITRNEMTHSQKNGAIMLIQDELESRGIEVEHELFQDTLAFKTVYLQAFLEILDHIQHNIAKNSPLNGFIEEKKELLKRKSPAGMPYDGDIPF